MESRNLPAKLSFQKKEKIAVFGVLLFLFVISPIGPVGEKPLKKFGHYYRKWQKWNKDAWGFSSWSCYSITNYYRVLMICETWGGDFVALLFFPNIYKFLNTNFYMSMPMVKLLKIQKLIVTWKHPYMVSI